jgi:hypothetical protein
LSKIALLRRFCQQNGELLSRRSFKRKSFASPLSHPAHLLVMGPGGYRFADYVKVGVPLTIITIAVSVWLLPILWLP